MENEALQRLARIERGELADPGPDVPLPERGRHLRRLLESKGIDPGRFYRVEYFPSRHCWLVTQDEEPPGAPARRATRGPEADELFYVRAIADFQRVARAACAALAAHSMHFARFGRSKYELPEPERDVSLSDLVNLLGGGDDQPPIHFDSEGRWREERPS